MNSKDKIYTCKICGRKLKSWKSIQRGAGSTWERKYLENLYKKQQISIESIMNKPS